jgi:serine phosphatase RsbU (regulator of sigma subunit)
VVRAHSKKSAQQLLDAIFADLDRFNPELFDDQTVVVLKVK